MKKNRIIFICLSFFAVFTLGAKIIEHFSNNNLQSVQSSRSIDLAETIAYEQHRFYGESLYFDSTTSFSTYTLQNLHTNTTYYFEASTLNDEGILLAELTEGIYQIQLDGSTLEATDFSAQTWYTIMRNGEANQVSLFTSTDNLVYLQVDLVTELPEDVYDLVIDPGHGGLDSGAIGYGLYESDEVLKFSQVLSDYLTEEYGLKVKLTREDDSEPAGDETYSLEQSPYYENGRVDQVYQSQAKLLISNHLNTTATGTASGFQIYSAFETTNTFALSMSEALQSQGLSPSSLESSAALGSGTYKQVDYCEERIEGMINCTQEYEDYFFIIRETGGLSTGAQNIINYNYQYATVPNYGAQAFLVEYAFIDNYSDNLDWQQNWQNYAIAIGDAIADSINLEK
ncbi:MAG: N-acetylmuramoyl-L-alanine amidase family protein [Culicoidibacterales bacterium]